MIHLASTPPARRTVITVRGEEWTISYGYDSAEIAEPDDVYQTGETIAFVWVECVNLGGRWYVAEEVFSSDMCDELDAELKRSLF